MGLSLGNTLLPTDNLNNMIIKKAPFAFSLMTCLLPGDFVAKTPDYTPYRAVCIGVDRKDIDTVKPITIDHTVDMGKNISTFKCRYLSEVPTSIIEDRDISQ